MADTFVWKIRKVRIWCRFITEQPKSLLKPPAAVSYLLDVILYLMGKERKRERKKERKKECEDFVKYTVITITPGGPEYRWMGHLHDDVILLNY